jgi:hypothetical protein
MAEYIDREAVLNELNKNNITKAITFADGVSIFDRIKNFPTADVVEVVRCGQCEHFHEYPYRGTSDPSGWGKCKKIGMDIDLTINDFCSYGERKEGADFLQKKMNIKRSETL